MSQLTLNPLTFLLSPTARKQKNDLLNALTILESAVHELQSRSELGSPNLKTREILQQSDSAIHTIKNYIDHQFDCQQN